MTGVCMMTLRGVAQCAGLAGLGVLIFSGALGGCAAAVPTVGDAAGAALDTSGKLLDRGKAETQEWATIADVIMATQKAADQLALQKVKEYPHPDQLKLTYTDLRKQEIVVTIVRRTPQMTEIHADVGLLGEEGLPQIMVRQILKNLPERTVDKDTKK